MALTLADVHQLLDQAEPEVKRRTSKLSSSQQIVHLTKKHQEQLLREECAKRSACQAEALQLEKTAESSVHGIHRMALHSLINNKKQQRYDEETLKQFNIDISSPAIVLLHENPLERKVYDWPHQVIRAFHAASSAVENEMIMYLIASRPELNQTCKFLLSYMIKNDMLEVKDLLVSIMLMQSNEPQCSTENRQHPCSQISKLKTFLSQQNIDVLLQQPLKNFSTGKTMIRVDKIQKCLSRTDWALRNAPLMVRLVDMVLKVATKEAHYKMLQSAIHPLLPSSFSGSWEEFHDMCPWACPDAFSLGVTTSYEIHPASGRVPLVILMCWHMGGEALSYYKTRNWPSSLVSIIVSSPKDVIDTAEKTYILEQFAQRTCGVVELADIRTQHKLWNWDFSHEQSSSSDWKKAILLVNEVFRPRFGVQTTPDYTKLLIRQDQQELRGKIARKSPAWM